MRPEKGWVINMIKGLPKNLEFKDLFIELVKLYKPRVYMELGTKKGYTFNAISPLVWLAVGVDSAGFSDSVQRRDNTVLYKMKTDDFVNVWSSTKKDMPVDFLFIDACHEKDQVLRDFDNFSPFVTDGTGLIFLHDTHPMMQSLIDPGYCDNSHEAAWEIRTSDKYKTDFEIVTLPGPTFGLSIIRKAKKQLAWRVE